MFLSVVRKIIMVLVIVYSVIRMMFGLIYVGFISYCGFLMLNRCRNWFIVLELLLSRRKKIVVVVMVGVIFGR